MKNIELEAKMAALNTIKDRADESIGDKLKGLKSKGGEKMKSVMEKLESPTEEAEEVETDEADMSVEEIDMKIAELMKLKADKMDLKS